MDQERCAEPAQDRDCLARPLRGVGRDPDVERLALAHGSVQRAHGFLERRLRVEAVRVEDVDVLEAQPFQTLLEAREQVLARAPLTVGAGPHVVARLRRNDELVTERAQVLVHEEPEVLLRRAVRWAVVVREVEVRDPEVEGSPDYRSARVEGTIVAEVVPEAERDGRELEAAPTGAVVGHLPVAAFSGNVGHRASLVSARSSSPRVAPVMIATASGMVCVWGVTTATRVPSRMIWIRSASSKTCGMSWLIRITGRPRSRTRRIRSSTCRVSFTPSAAVGSS